MYPDQLVSGQLIQIYTVFKTSYTQVQHGMGHFTLFTGHHISVIFMPPKELWEAYSNRTVRPCVRPCVRPAFVSGPYLLYSLR